MRTHFTRTHSTRTHSLITGLRSPVAVSVCLSLYCVCASLITLLGLETPLVGFTYHWLRSSASHITGSARRLHISLAPLVGFTYHWLAVSCISCSK